MGGRLPGSANFEMCVLPRKLYINMKPVHNADRCTLLPISLETVNLCHPLPISQDLRVHALTWRAVPEPSVRQFTAPERLRRERIRVRIARQHTQAPARCAMAQVHEAQRVVLADSVERAWEPRWRGNGRGRAPHDQEARGKRGRRCGVCVHRREVGSKLAREQACEGADECSEQRNDCLCTHITSAGWRSARAKWSSLTPSYVRGNV